MELSIEKDGVYLIFNRDGQVVMRPVALYNINDQEYMDDDGVIGIYFDDYGRIATCTSVTDEWNGTYTYLP